MNKLHGSEQDVNPGKHTSKTIGRALKATAAIALLASCANTPANNSNTAVHKPTPVEKPAKPHKEVKLSAEAQTLTDQAQTGSEALATKLYDKFLHAQRKDTYTKPGESGSLYEVFGIDLDTGHEDKSGYPIQLHMHAVLGHDFYTDEVLPEMVESIDISLRRKGAGYVDYDADFEIQLRKNKHGWDIGYKVDADGTTYDGVTLPQFSTTDTSKSIRPEQLENIFEVANKAIDGEIQYPELYKLVLPE